MRNMTTDRVEATRRVMKALARLASNGPLPVKLEDGTSPVVIAMPSDSVKDLAKQLKRAGGVANVLVAYPDHFALSALEETPSATSIDEVAEVNQLSDVDMLVHWMRTLPEHGGSFTVTGDKDSGDHAPMVQDMDYVF